jgi:branched-subunit amino acid aminotransferase/4-amino-4-deoxychorismate lyase
VTSIELDKNGFPKGEGVFETIKTISGAPIALNRHMRRALESCAELGIDIPKEEIIREAIKRVIQENPHVNGRLRICFGRDLFHISHGAYIEEATPARVNFYSSSVRGDIHKRFPYDFRFSILQAARDEGFTDSLLFNEKNELTETSISNIAISVEGEWVTPPITSGILPGVVRAIAIEECGVKVRPIHISEIPKISEALLLSSLRIAQPISHIGDMELKIGDASRLLQEQLRVHMEPTSVG